MVEYPLSTKDTALLAELSHNARLSIAELARKTRLSRSAVAKKLARLEKELGLRYTLLLNRELLPGNDILAFFKLYKPIPEDDLLAELRASHIPQWAALTKGDFELVILCRPLSAKQFDDWEIAFNKKFTEHIADWSTAAIGSVRFGSLLLRPELLAQIKLKKPRDRLLALLHKDARMPLQKIAKVLEISPALAAYHLRELLHSGIIKGTSISVSENYYPDITISLLKAHITPKFEEINRRSRAFLLENIIHLVHMARLIGEEGAIQIMAFKNMDELRAFEEKDAEISGEALKITRSALILKQLLTKLEINPFKPKELYRLPSY